MLPPSPVFCCGWRGSAAAAHPATTVSRCTPPAGGQEVGETVRELVGRADWTTVGHLVEYPLVYAELTCRQNLELAARLGGVASGAIEQIVTATLTELHLTQYADRRARILSLGNRQGLGLASALQHDPRLIMLDEPTNALDPSGVEALLRRAGRGAGVLVSSHHLDEVARIADRISVLNAGRIIGSIDPHGIDIERSFFDLVLADETVTR